MSRQAVVLAGGLALRMRPHTLHTPKVLLDVAGRPFVDWLLERLAACGTTEVVLCVGHLGARVREHVGGGAQAGLRVIVSDEGEEPRGTLGALRLALPHLAPEFLVTYGDSYLPFDYASPLDALSRHDDCDGVMSVFANAHRWDASNVLTDGEWVRAYEKGTTDPAFDHIDYGALALRRAVVARLPEGHRGGLDVLQRELASTRRLRAVVARERFFEIGSPAGLSSLAHHLEGRT
ncbi:MAG: NTP transferase domain-containing protein [Polyangiaceae bacterium]|nr:NTP transferase domain-containing protein [Polyangiaceae bacterium]